MELSVIYIGYLGPGQGPDPPPVTMLFTACKNINPFKSYAHICEHLPGPYYRDCHVDYISTLYP